MRAIKRTPLIMAISLAVLASAPAAAQAQPTRVELTAKAGSAQVASSKPSKCRRPSYRRCKRH